MKFSYGSSFVILATFLLAAFANLKESVYGQTRKTSQVAIINFVNTTGSTSYNWLMESLPEAIDKGMKRVFIYQRLLPKKKQDLAMEIVPFSQDYTVSKFQDFCKKSRVDYVVYGSFVLDKTQNKIKVYAGVYFKESNRIIRQVQTYLNTDSSIFNQVSKVADSLVSSIKTHAKRSRSSTRLRIKSQSSSGIGTAAWMSSNALQKTFDRNVKKKYYPTYIEGRANRGLDQYRGVFKRYPTSNYAFACYWGMSSEGYRKREKEYKGKGYVRVYFNTYRSTSGQTTYQALWEKR